MTNFKQVITLKYKSVNSNIEFKDQRLKQNWKCIQTYDTRIIEAHQTSMGMIKPCLII